MSGILILLAFVAFAALMYARVLPALLAVPAMAIVIVALAGLPLPGIGDVVTNGAAALASVYATVIFGAILGRATMQTGIAETIVAYAAEFGGDQPFAVCMIMCAAVAVLFTSLTGLGAIIMVGSIVLPIMITVGVPRTIAATTFLLAFAAGFIFNIAEWTFYTKFFGVERGPLFTYALLLFAIDAAVLVTFAAVRFRRVGALALWSVPATDALPPARRAPPWALIAPVLPIVLYLVFHVSAIVAFAVAAVYAAVATRPSQAVRVLTTAAIRGVEDVAPAVILFMGIGMLLEATKTPQVADALRPIVAFAAPHSPLGYVLLFGVLSPLALFRGPLNPYGIGIGVYAVLSSLGVVPPIALAAAVMAVVQVQNPCDPTNTQNVWVANFTGVSVDEITRMLLPWQTAVATIGCVAVVALGPQLLGVHPFASAIPSAEAAAAVPSLPGLLAPASARGVLGVVAHDTASEPAAAVVRAQIGGGWKGFRVLALAQMPPMAPCDNAPYDGYLDVSLSSWRGVGSVTTDAGIELYDCAGWSVDQWHEQRTTAAPPDRDAVEALALAALFRLRTWTVEQQALADALFTTGLAYVPGVSAPSYFYTLFKTDDGYMRAYVRPGGPAYVAGLRTDDVVDKVDGRFWWEYGTYQTQQRAYDGKPHVFDVTRGKRQLTVRLGAPL